jgi:hypothetical protein
MGMETRICTKCGEERPIEDFTFKSIAKGIRHTRCRDCTREAVREHYQAHQSYYVRKARERNAEIVAAQREWIMNYLELHHCVDCGEADPRCLDFDHVRGKKRCDISKMVGDYGWAAIEEEIAKCEVRCANCHRKRTVERREAARSWQGRP